MNIRALSAGVLFVYLQHILSVERKTYDETEHDCP